MSFFAMDGENTSLATSMWNICKCGPVARLLTCHVARAGWSWPLMLGHSAGSKIGGQGKAGAGMQLLLLVLEGSRRAWCTVLAAPCRAQGRPMPRPWAAACRAQGRSMPRPGLPHAAPGPPPALMCGLVTTR